MQERHSNPQQYFEEQILTTRKYVLPYIQQFLPLKAGMKVLEIGCGQGGSFIPFLELGCTVTGIDMSTSSIEFAQNQYNNSEWNENVTLILDNIYNLADSLGEYDLILMRDVIEHIHDQDRFLAYVRRFLKKEGIFVLVFPPWYSPFGGHQQICRSKILSKLPYFHILPRGIYEFILKSFGENPEGLTEIHDTGISIERFERIIKKYDYKIINRIIWFINPHYETKFGLRPRKQFALVAALPFIRNFISTSSYYAIRRGA
jgi:SAM-dependent methyltransferase